MSGCVGAGAGCPVTAVAGDNGWLCPWGGWRGAFPRAVGRAIPRAVGKTLRASGVEGG